MIDDPLFTPRAKPETYGSWWNNNEKGLDWYEEIFNSRRVVHEAFLDWVRSLDAQGRGPCSILEVGCGRAITYPEFFKARRYFGFDVSAKEIDWCRLHRASPGHEYGHGDIIEARFAEKFGLVFSHAVIDHVYDINAFLAALVGASSGWVYVTSYRGWFPDLASHTYRWNETDTCFYNDISAPETKALLGRLGCRHIRVFPLGTLKAEIPQETVILAHV